MTNEERNEYLKLEDEAIMMLGGIAESVTDYSEILDEDKKSLQDVLDKMEKYDFSKETLVEQERRRAVWSIARLLLSVEELDKDNQD